ncbi:MAG TPA: hypothetical protein VIL20_04095 [Sandaracinaceae bacterium]
MSKARVLVRSVALLVAGCSAPLEPFCVITSADAFCPADASGAPYDAVCPNEADGAALGTRPATCTDGRLDPCPDGSAPRCMPAE